MPEINDFDLRPDSPTPPLSPPTEPGRGSLSRVIGVLTVAAVLVLGYVLYSRRVPPASPELQERPSHAAEPAVLPPVALGSQPEDIAVPPLDESDAVVRTLVQMLSTNPDVMKWLATDGLIRNFTLVVDNIANGRTPTKQLQVLKPQGVFRVQGQGEALRIDPAGYARYDPLARAVDSVDAAAAARVYATLKPRIEEASRELGNTDPFDRTLENAIVRLLKTPVDAGAQPLLPKGAEGYKYANAEMEALSGAQKLLIRMGPENARTVQRKLREIALALGIPADRL